MGAFRLKKVPRIPALSPVLVAVIASISLIVIGFELFADLLFVTPPETLCPLRAGTGIPCPGCGGTRSARSLLEFDLPSALAHNPLLAFGALVVCAALGIRLIFGCTIDSVLTQRQWGLLGILTFLDPPRHDTKETIERAHDYGVDVKMITGDQQLIAIETCRMLGMGTTVLTAECLPSGDETFSKELGKNFGELCENADGFAEVYPEHKYAIVETLRQRGFMCGMTGDGVNDAPAMNQADIGIAMGSGSEVSKETANLVLADDNFANVVVGISLGRLAFENLKKVLLYLLPAGTFCEMLTVLANVRYPFFLSYVF